MGEKRKNDGTSASGKKKYKLNPGMIDPSTSGLYATCHRKRETNCAKELMEILEEAAEELYGDALRADDEENAGDADEDDDEELSIEEALKKEVDGLKKKKVGKKDPIRAIELGCECVVFFKTRRPIEPERLVEKVVQTAVAGKCKNTRFTQKLTPITNSVSASLDEVKKLAEKVLAPHFHKSEGQEPYKFAINVSSRNFNSVDKTEIRNLVAKCVGNENGHKVDLKNYDKLIIVECFKNNIGMSVVDDYNKYNKYNLQQIFEVRNAGQKLGESRVNAEKKDVEKKEKTTEEKVETTDSEKTV